MSRAGLHRLAAVSFIGACLSACTNEQSALHATGEEAARVATLFWVMTVGGGLILAGVCLLAGVAIFGGERARRFVSQKLLVVAGGLAFPVVVLTALLAYGLIVLASRAAAPDPASVLATVTGEQWWWRVSYPLADGGRVESANELHIPVGEPVALGLETADVLHSFWVPNLAGKLDMVPGRTNVLTLQATQAGVSRGQCAEYCGGAHAFMAFHVIAQSRADFDAWLRREAGPSVVPETERLRAGAEIFQEAGCGACHTVRGTDAGGTIGPDLTHVGSRRTLAAATLPNTAQAFADWIVANQHIKPENRMPPFAILNQAELTLLAEYLESLQ